MIIDGINAGPLLQKALTGEWKGRGILPEIEGPPPVGRDGGKQIRDRDATSGRVHFGE